MYVCLCKGITDTQIRAAIQDGASSLRDLRNNLGVCCTIDESGGLMRKVIAAKRSAA